MNFEKDSYIKLLERVNDIQQMKIQEISSKDIFAKLLQTPKRLTQGATNAVPKENQLIWVIPLH